MNYNISLGPSNLDEIIIDDIEHIFHRKISIYHQILSWISLILINMSNGYVIYIMKPQIKTPFDQLILMDSVLCVFNTIPILRLTFFYQSFFSNAPLCALFTFFGFFTNVTQRLISLGIAVYRYFYVVKHTMVQTQVQNKLFKTVLFSAIIIMSIVDTVDAFYRRETYKHYQGIHYFIGLLQTNCNIITLYPKPIQMNHFRLLGENA